MLKKRLILFLFAFVLFTEGGYGQATYKRVLFISSYNPSFPTYNQQIDGLRAVFDNEAIILDVEFLDSKRFNKEEYINIYTDMLTYKLSGSQSYDVIIAADDNALNFCLEKHQSLLKSVPIIFFGVNNVDKALSLVNDPLVTGFIEAVSMRDTIALMTELFPDSKNIVALVDGMTSGQADLVEFYKLSNQFPGYRFSDISLENLDWNEFEYSLQNLDSRSSVLLLSAYFDKNGSGLLFYESLDLICRNLDLPLFHLWFHGFGQGIFGGKVISHYEQAKDAAKAALQIMNGKDPADIPISSEADNVYMFDYEQMKRFFVSEKQLPKGSLIINKPYSFYRENTVQVWAAVGVFAFLVVMLVLELVNINKRKRTETALRESEQKYRAIFYDNSSVILLLEPSTGRILDANEAASEYYGYTVPELTGMKIGDINMLYDYETNSSMEKVLSGERGGFNLKHRLSSGEIRDVEVFSGFLGIGGHDYLYSIIHDVTEKNNYFREMEYARIQAESALRIKNDFLANVSHELRTPLNGVMGMLELLAGANFSPREVEWYRLAMVSTGNLKVIIEDLLNFTEFSTGKLSLSNDFFSLDNLAALTSELFNDALQEKNLCLSVQKQYRSGYFFGDETRITQIFHNLISNAIKYSEKGCVVCKIIEESGLLVLVVSDEGHGMTEEEISLIFEPFRQLENIYTKTHRGMGLGLAIVKNIVDKAGGEIKVDSSPGKGTVFTVSIKGEFKR